MKKSNPDRERIPTLHDLVFPGNQELRRLQNDETERVEPTLNRDDDSDSRPRLSVPVEEEYTDGPFVLLPDEPDEYLSLPRTVDEHVETQEETLPKVPGTDAPSEPADQPDAEAGEHETAARDTESEAGQRSHGIIKRDSLPADKTVTEEEISIADLVTYFYRPSAAPPAASSTAQEPDFHLAETPGHPPPPRMDPPPPAELQNETALEAEIRAAVHDILESEIAQLTERVTAAVLARLDR